MTLHVATASAVSSGTSSSGKARWWLWQIKHQRWQLQHVFIYICKSSETTTENESQPCSADFSWSTIKAMLNTVISQQAGLIMDIMEWFKWSLVVLTDLPGQADRPPPRLISSPSWKTSFWTVPSPANSPLDGPSVVAVSFHCHRYNTGNQWTSLNLTFKCCSNQAYQRLSSTFPTRQISSSWIEIYSCMASFKFARWQLFFCAYDCLWIISMNLWEHSTCSNI